MQRSIYLLATLTLAGCASSIPARRPAATDLRITQGTEQVCIVGGKQIYSVADRSLDDYAQIAKVRTTGRPVIMYNPDKISALGDAERAFVFYHECGHLAREADGQPNTEEGADCWAARHLQREHGYGPGEISVIKKFLVSLGAARDPLHGDGPLRAAGLAGCLNR